MQAPFPFEFHPWPWEQLHDKFVQIAAQNPDFRYLADITASILSSGVADELAGLTSMYDLIVASQPLSAPPFEIVRVRAPNSAGHAPKPGNVRIEHHSLSGNDDALERPATEAVSLFWRFMIEKFGVRATTV